MPDQIFDNEHEASSSFASSSSITDTPVPVNRPSWHCRITVEPALILDTIAIALCSSVLTQLLLVRTCEVTLGYPSDKCNQLINRTQSKEAHDIENLAQPYVTLLQMYQSIIEASIPLILSIFVGAWSDLHGRKPLMMWPIFGHGVQFALLAIMSSVKSLPPEFILLASIPIACSGGFVTCLTGVYSYMSDITSDEKRSFRMGLLNASVYGGFGIGMLCSAPLFNSVEKYGYLTVFSVSSILALLSFFYMTFLPESVNVSQTEGSRGNLWSIFDYKLAARMVSTCCKRRENYGRSIIFLLAIIMATCILTTAGEAAVVFLFVRNKLGWNLSNYMNYCSFNLAVSVIGATIGMYVFSVWLKISDSIFAVAVFITNAVQVFLTAFASTPVYLYIASVVGAIGVVSGPLCRSILSKSVPQEDIGAVFALTGMVEAMGPLAAAPLYNLVYNATLVSFPGTFFLISGGLYILDIILLVVVVVQQRITSHQYSLLVNEYS